MSLRAGREAGMSIFWLVERQIDGRAHWLAWRGRDRCEWVTDATQADRFDWAIAAQQQARLIRDSQGIECQATEHAFMEPAP